MALSLANPADITNAALGRIGYKLRVGNLYDGSRAAKAALDIYGQTRDELLRQNDWGFAERNVSMTLLKSAPPGGYVPPTVWDATLYPPLPWNYAWAYPSECLKVRAVKPAPIFFPSYDPQPFLFGISNDNTTTPATKIIMTMQLASVLVYTGQVTDPLTFEADFLELFIDALGRRLAPLLAGPEFVKLQAGAEQQSMTVAEMNQG